MISFQKVGQFTDKLTLQSAVHMRKCRKLLQSFPQTFAIAVFSTSLVAF